MSDERPLCWMCAEGAAKDGAEIERLRALVEEMRDALWAAVDCGIVPSSSASKDGGGTQHSRQVRVADRMRAALAKADEVLK